MKSLMKFFIAALVTLLSCFPGVAQNRDPLRTEIITTDLDNFWIAFEAARPDFKPEIFQQLYLDKGSPGLNGMIERRIKNAETLAKVISTRPRYYASVRSSSDSIGGMSDRIRGGLVKLKELYPGAVFPPVYFVIGAMNSGGTSSKGGLIIGSEMFALTPSTPLDELNDWQRSVIKPVSEVPHIVAHELIHFQQKYDGKDLLSGSIKEGAADFLAELISGRHINQHVHDFANPREKELWIEFKERMHGKDFTGWLYTSTDGRPADLGYWMGYQITKSYYDNASDKKKAVSDIMHIRDFDDFLEASRYPEKF
jgi:hypothetical protein